MYLLRVLVSGCFKFFFWVVGLRGFPGSRQFFGEIVPGWLRDVQGMWLVSKGLTLNSGHGCRNHGCWHSCAAMCFQAQR